MKLNLIKKMSLLILTGAVFTGAVFADENAKVKEMVSPQLYEQLIKEGSIADYRYDGLEEFKLLPKSVYSDGLFKTMIKKEPGNFPYTYEGLHLIKKADLLHKNKSSSSNDPS